MGGSICEELGWWMRKNMITAHWIRVRHSQRINKSIIALKKPNWRTSEMSPWLKMSVIKPGLDSWGPHDGRRTPKSCSLPSRRHTFKWKDLESRTTITQNHNHAGEPENRQASLELPATILPPKFLGLKVRTTTPGLYLFLIKETLNTHCNPSSLIFKLEARKSSLYRQMLRRAGKLCMTGWWQRNLQVRTPFGTWEVVFDRYLVHAALCLQFPSFGTVQPMFLNFSQNPLLFNNTYEHTYGGGQERKGKPPKVVLSFNSCQEGYTY